MVSNDLIELSRLESQKNIDSQKLRETRRKMGQFATPMPLAKEIIQYAANILDKQEIYFLDPAFGTGAFYSALMNVFSSNQIKEAVGVEIDETYLVLRR